MAPDRRIPSTERRHRDPESRDRRDDKSLLRPRSRVVAIALAAIVILSDPGFIGIVADWVSSNCL